MNNNYQTKIALILSFFLGLAGVCSGADFALGGGVIR